jgi:hypothetical protein
MRNSRTADNSTHFPQVTPDILDPPVASLTSGVHEHLRGDIEKREEVALELGQLGIEPLDETRLYLSSSGWGAIRP